MSDADPPDDGRTDLFTLAGPLFDAVRGVRWETRQTAAPGAIGGHPSRRRGGAAEFTEYRPYRQGDDPRRLDWRLLARTDRAYVRITDDHSLVPTLLVVDASASMAYPRPSLAKWRCAQLVALGLAFVAHSEGDPVGLTVVATASSAHLASTWRTILVQLASVLQSVDPEGSGALAPALDRLAHPARARIVIISDFLGDESDARARVRRLTAAGATCTAVHVVAREELMPPDRALLVSDPENAAVRRPLTASSRPRYLEQFAEWRATLRQAWQTAGGTYVLATTDEPVDRIVRRIARPLAHQTP